MLKITVTLGSGSGEQVHIDWYGARPVNHDLAEFLASQFPHSEIKIEEV